MIFKFIIFANEMNMKDFSPEVAIISDNTLQNIGLAGIIERLMPEAIVRCFNSFTELTDDTPDAYFHYFVSMQIAAEHTAFFSERQRKTIILTKGTPTQGTVGRFLSIDISLKEHDFIKAFLTLSQQGKPQREKLLPPHHAQENELTPRENDVLRLIVKGLINKEIADKLNISITTVVSHRKNIMEKLNIHSVSGLTVYAVMNGIIEINEI